MDVNLLCVVPSNTLVRFLLTSSDVLHSYSIPELGVKMDAVPGRLNQFMVLSSRAGVYYGQCSELCGISHGFMPISIQSVSYDSFFKVISDGINNIMINNLVEDNRIIKEDFMCIELYKFFYKEEELINKVLDIYKSIGDDLNAFDVHSMELLEEALTYLREGRALLDNSESIADYLKDWGATPIEVLLKEEQAVVRAVIYFAYIKE